MALIGKGRFYRAREAWERETVRAEIERSGGVEAAARSLEINRTHFYKLIKRLGITNPNAAHRGEWYDV